MEVVLIIFLVLFVIAIAYLLFVFVKWLLSNKTRRIWTASLLGVFIIATIVNTIFFKKMEFIPSEVYSDLYLIKNPIRDKAVLNTIIKNKVTQNINSQLNGNEEQLKTTMRFYKYFKGWGTIPFGKAGTAHFIKNEEDPGGFSSELLEYYPKYKMATFNWMPCKGNATYYFGNLSYYENGLIIKTDTLFNSCQ